MSKLIRLATGLSFTPKTTTESKNNNLIARVTALRVATNSSTTPKKEHSAVIRVLGSKRASYESGQRERYWDTRFGLRHIPVGSIDILLDVLVKFCGRVM